MVCPVALAKTFLVKDIHEGMIPKEIPAPTQTDHS
jgi:hypothetical protein